MARYALPWAYQSNSGRARIASLERLVNLYPERSNSTLASNSDATDVVLLFAPGCRPYKKLNDDTDVVHLYSTGETLFAWTRKGLYQEVNGAFLRVFEHNIGKRVIASHGERVGTNGQREIDLWFTDKTRSFMYNVNSRSTRNQSLDLSFYPTSSATYLDGYAIWSRRETGEFFWSEIQNYSTYNGLNFASAEGNSDDIVRIVAFERELWIFGKNSLEIFQNTGDANAPFQRLSNAFFEVGAVNADVITKLSRDIYWISDDLRVMRSAARSYRPEPVSLHQGVEHDLYEYGAETAFAFAVTFEGHSQYWLTLPEANRTWVFDESTSLWHERSSLIDGRLIGNNEGCENKTYGQHFATSGTMHKGKAYIGGKGGVFTLDLNYGLDGDQKIFREATTSPVRLLNDFALFNKVELEFQNDCGFLDSSCDRPTDEAVILGWSDDFAKTWCEGSPKWITKDDNSFPSWNSLGRSRARAFRWRTYYPGQMAFLRSIMYAEAFGRGG